MGGRRADLFPPDRALQLRMGVALVTAVLLTVIAIAVVAWLAVVTEWWLAVFVVSFGLAGFQADKSRRKRSKSHERHSPRRPPEQRRVEQLVIRLSALSGQPAPRIAFEPGEAPLGWTTALPGQRPTIHVTRGLIAKCRAADLEVVLAHELSHIANRDAWVMTVVSGPPTWVLGGIREYWEDRHDGGSSWFKTFRYAIGVAVLGSWLAALVLPGALTARLVSRHRELVADRSAALLTGSPAGVAATLRKLSGTLDGWPRVDLRRAELLNFLPANSTEPTGLARLWATHPTLERRCAQLDRMERELQAAR